MRRIALATGVELAVDEYGDGTPVLLLHAWGETHHIFDRLVPLLLDTLQLIVPDQRGVGESSKPPGGYGLFDAVDDVVALLDEMGVDTCWIAGTSSGGYVAQQLALSHPERVSGLVLIGAPSNLQRRSPDFLVQQLSLFHDPVTRDDIHTLNGVLPLHAVVPESYLEDQVLAALTIPSHVWRAGLEGLIAAEPPIQRGSITVPTLILWGEEEDVLPAEQGEELAEAIEGSHLVTYEGTGHLVLVERPERVAEDMISFIAGLPDSVRAGTGTA